MEKESFDKILLKTAFCCMASDGDIDTREIELLKSIFANNPLHKDIKFDDKMNSFIKIYNEKGKSFFTFYFDLLRDSSFTEEEELAIIDIALKTIYADEVVEYSEIKFFRVIRRNLKISDEKILLSFPDIEQFLVEDIVVESNLEKIINQYLDAAELPQFNLLTSGKKGEKD